MDCIGYTADQINFIPSATQVTGFGVGMMCVVQSDAAEKESDIHQQIVLGLIWRCIGAITPAMTNHIDQAV